MQAVGGDADAGRRADDAALEAVVRGVAAPVPVAEPEEGAERRQGRCGLLCLSRYAKTTLQRCDCRCQGCFLLS